MGADALAATPLEGIVRLAGAIFTAGTSILVLIVTKPPQSISAHPMFTHTRGLIAVLIAVFLSLTWGLLGNTAATAQLAGIAGAATALGFLAFFWVARLVEVGTNAAARRNPTLLLFSYVLYSVLISWGLTAATIFLSVLLLNPSNPASVAIAQEITYVADIRVDGTVDIPSDVDVPFRVTSGQVNLGCSETKTLSVPFQLPPGSSFVGQPIAQWENWNNAPGRDAAVTVQEGAALATGSIRGLEFQTFPFGIQNCLGGGHGELVLSGTYRTRNVRLEARSVDLRSHISSSTRGPVVVSLPTDTEMTIQRATVVARRESDPETSAETAELTPATPVQVLAAGRLVASLNERAREVRFEWSR